MEKCLNKKASGNQCGNLNGFNQCNFCFKRPRLLKLFESALDYPLVVVCAGVGYGKTRAVHSFLQEYEAHAIWMQLSERDNNVSRFWESYTGAISQMFPDAGKRLAKLGFPETDEALVKYVTVMREIAMLPGKHIRVFDDFHLLNNHAVLNFFERIVRFIPSNVTLLLISRTIPDFNMIGMMMRENIFTIQENALCFTEDEIAEHFNQLNLSATSVDIRNIYNDTQGWAFAVNLVGRSLAKKQKYERYAIEAMKKNVFRLIESEISGILSNPLWRFLLRISLIDHLAASLIKILANDDKLIKEMELLNAYIRYDFYMDTYLIHNLFLDYLRQKQEEFLTDEERRETYQTAGKWCDKNSYHMDAFSYYEKSGDYDAIMSKLAAFNAQMPMDMAQYVLEIFARMPENIKSQNPIFPSMHLKLKIALGQFDEALVLAERYAEDYKCKADSQKKTLSLTAIYATWAFLRKTICTYTDVYDFDIYYKKMSEYFDKDSLSIFSSYEAMSSIAWASLVGTSRAGAQEEYIDAVSRATQYTSHVLSGVFVGYDDLLHGELYFYQGEFEAAEQYLKQSVDKAHTYNQYVTQSHALAYLMRIAFLRGNFADVNDWLQAMEIFLNEKDYDVCYTMHDIARGFYYLTLEQPEQIPTWLKGDFSAYAHPAFIENYANRIKAQYHYQKGNYRILLSFIESEMKQRTILFWKIELKLLESLSHYHLKQRGEAFSALTEAYELAESNGLVIFFIQYSKDMRTLTNAAIRDGTCAIPKPWLENINRKASAYAKRQSRIILEYMTANNIHKEITLTKREAKILKDLSLGLSRTEIAASYDISTNTVKVAINSIYEKLKAGNLVDAVRIAATRKII